MGRKNEILERGGIESEIEKEEVIESRTWKGEGMELELGRVRDG
jgi:hypothetical protein